MHKLLLSFLVCAVATQFTGCSMLTKNGRSQAAYSRYLKRSSSAQMKQKIKYGKPKKIESPVPSDPATATESSGPESTTSGNPQP